MINFKKLIAVFMIATLFVGCTTTGNNADSNANSNTQTSTDDSAQTGDDAVVSTDDTGLKILNLNNATEPGSLHPAMATGTHDSWIIDNCFVGLYQKTPEGVPEMAMAKEAHTSEDGKTWTFKIRDDIVWSNGDPLTANDFIYNWMFCLDPDNASKYASQLYIIEGAEAYNSGEGSAEDVGVKALDDYTIEMKLVNPLSYLPDLLTHYTFMPVSQKNAEEHPDWYLSPDNYVTNGPFYMTEWASKDKIVLVKNDKYYDADKVNLDEVHFIMTEDKATEWQLYEEGELDLVYSLLPAVIEQMTEENNPELDIEPDLALYYYMFNQEKKPFNNVKVRKALAMAIDRTVLTEQITKGGQVPAYSITPVEVKMPDGRNYSDVVTPGFTEDVEEARVLLEEGLAEEGMSVDDFSFELLYNTNDIHKRIAETIQSMWNQNLGVHCTLANAEFQVVLDRRTTGDFDVVRAGWVGDYVDPMTFLELFTSWSDFNEGHYANEDFDNLIKAASQEVDPEKRAQILVEADNLASSELACLPIYFYTKQIAVKPYVTGIFTPINKYPNFRYADIVQ